MEVVDGKTTTVTITNDAMSNITIRKVDGDTGAGLYGALFIVYDKNGKPMGEYSSNNYGYAYVEDIPDGRYTIREITAPEGYNVDNTPKTVTVQYGKSSEITWKNYAEKAQIQVVKRSSDYNPTNGLPAGTLLSGAVFEIFNRVGTKVDTMTSNESGLAASKPLPLGTYTIKETKAPANYATDGREYIVYLEYPNQISRMEMTNKPVTTQVTIEKVGPSEVVANQPVVYTLNKIANNSNTSLESFYWKDTLPWQATCLSVVTGTYNSATTYKIVYRVNGGEYRTLADNLSTQTNYTLDASPTALGLASDQKVTELMVVFGIVPAQFTQVEKPVLHCISQGHIVGGTSFVNIAEVGGIYNGQWIQGVSRWVTKVYGLPTPLLKTGY